MCPTLRNVGEWVGGGGGCIGPNIMGATASHPSCSGGALGSRGQRYLQGKVWRGYLLYLILDSIAHRSDELDPDPINLKMTSRNVWNTSRSLFLHFFKVKGRIRIRSKTRIRICIKVTSRICSTDVG